MPNKRSRVRILPPKRDPETGEYVVEVKVDGRRCELRCYYTDDKHDAQGTYLAMMAEAEQAGENCE